MQPVGRLDADLAIDREINAAVLLGQIHHVLTEKLSVTGGARWDHHNG